MEKLSEGEWKLMELLWEDAPVNSTQLVARCREKLQWSKSTTYTCLLYTSPSPRDGLLSRMPSSA